MAKGIEPASPSVLPTGQLSLNQAWLLFYFVSFLTAHRKPSPIFQIPFSLQMGTKFSLTSAFPPSRWWLKGALVVPLLPWSMSQAICQSLQREPKLIPDHPPMNVVTTKPNLSSHPLGSAPVLCRWSGSTRGIPRCLPPSPVIPTEAVSGTHNRFRKMVPGVLSEGEPRDKAGFLSAAQLRRHVAWCKPPFCGKATRRKQEPSRGLTSQHHCLQPVLLQAWRVAGSVGLDCGSEANGNRSLRKHESPLPDYVLILLCLQNSLHIPGPQRTFPSTEALDSSRPAWEGNASILQMRN